MKDQTIEDQNELIKNIQSLGWEVTSTDLNEYKKRGHGSDVSGVEIDLTVYISYEEEDNQNPYRIN